MKHNQLRAVWTLGAIAGGLLAAASLPLAVAFADDVDFTPDATTFDPTQVEGYPPIDNVVTGTESWSLFDLTKTDVLPYALPGTDTMTTIGSFTNDDFLFQTDSLGYVLASGAKQFFVPDHTQIDLANFGGGFENEWIDMPANGTAPGVSDLLITPFGDFPLMGTAFSDLATVFG